MSESIRIIHIPKYISELIYGKINPPTGVKIVGKFKTLLLSLNYSADLIKVCEFFGEQGNLKYDPEEAEVKGIYYIVKHLYGEGAYKNSRKVIKLFKESELWESKVGDQKAILDFLEYLANKGITESPNIIGEIEGTKEVETLHSNFLKLINTDQTALKFVVDFIYERLPSSEQGSEVEESVVKYINMIK